jgi:hypothetical protein
VSKLLAHITSCLTKLNAHALQNHVSKLSAHKTKSGTQLAAPALQNHVSKLPVLKVKSGTQLNVLALFAFRLLHAHKDYVGAKTPVIAEFKRLQDLKVTEE